MPFPPKSEPKHLLSAAKEHYPAMLEQLETLVSIETPSQDKAAVNQAARLLAEWLQALGGKARWHRQKKFGDILEVRFPASPSRRKKNYIKPVMLLGHLDTVWPRGTLATMPFRIKNGRAYGPGIFDMKACVVMAVHALALMRETDAPHPPVIVLLNSEEEVGSPDSRVVTKKLGQECSAVFVLEPAKGPKDAYVTARKGIGQYSVHVQGIAAHSGVDFERGHSAVLELARQLEKISHFTDLETGVTVNPGIIRGGTLPNVIAADATAEIDVRITSTRDAARLERQFRALRPIDKACKLQITGGINRPHMERSAGAVRLFQQARELAGKIGFQLEEASTGGGSDGNFTAALGIPTLDGMGAVGEGAHAIHESIQLNMLAPRTALLAAMILRHAG